MMRKHVHFELEEKLPLPPRAKERAAARTTKKLMPKDCPDTPSTASPSGSSDEEEARRVADSSVPELFQLQHQLYMLSRQFGPRHALVAKTWLLLGSHHFRKQQYREALAAYRQVNCDHPLLTADAFANSGSVLFCLGQVEAALDSLLHAKRLYSRDCGDGATTRLAIANVRYQLGRLFHFKGDTEEALRQLQRCRKERLQVQGALPHLDMARVDDALGNVYTQQERYDEALECYHRALDTRRRFNDAAISTLKSIRIIHVRSNDPSRGR